MRVTTHAGTSPRARAMASSAAGAPASAREWDVQKLAPGADAAAVIKAAARRPKQTKMPVLVDLCGGTVTCSAAITRELKRALSHGGDAASATGAAVELGLCNGSLDLTARGQCEPVADGSSCHMRRQSNSTRPLGRQSLLAAQGNPLQAVHLSPDRSSREPPLQPVSHLSQSLLQEQEQLQCWKTA